MTVLKAYATLESMMVETPVSVEEYLTTDYSPDADYVEGRIEERNVGEKDHGKLQLKLANMLNSLGNVHAFIETRVKIAEKRYRVPDVCVFVDHEPDEQVFTIPPFLYLEILSPEDRMSRVMAVVQDYLDMGVPNVWILDASNQRAYIADSAGLRIVTERIGTTDGRVIFELAQVFG